MSGAWQARGGLKFRGELIIKKNYQAIYTMKTLQSTEGRKRKEK